MAAATQSAIALLRSDPDARLMLRVRRDDADAFRQLFDRYRNRVYGRLYGMVQHHEHAEDLTQDVFLRVYAHRKRYRPQARFVTWLFRIVQNVGRNALRSRRRFHRRFAAQQEGGSFDWVHDPLAPAPMWALLQQEFHDQLFKFGELTERQQTVVRLFYVEGCSCSELACRLNVTPQSVKSLLHRARASLRQSLASYGMVQ